MESTVKERIRSFVRHLNISEKEFCERCGFSRGYINSMRVSILPDKVSSIAAQFSELNTGWLLTGEGNMLRGNYSDETQKIPNVAEESIEYRKESINHEMSEYERNIWALIKSQRESIERQERSIERLETMNQKLIEEVLSKNKLGGSVRDAELASAG